MSEKVKTFRRKRNILAVNSLITYKGDLFVSVGATGEFWKYNGKKWTLEHQLPENQPWVGTTWGRTTWNEELWFAGLEASLDHSGILVHYDGEAWETIRPELGPEIWAVTTLGDALYAIDSKQILKTKNGSDWIVVSKIPGEREGRSIEALNGSLFVGTSHGLFSFDLKEYTWDLVLSDSTWYEIAKYRPFKKDWLIAGTVEKRGGPYHVFDGEHWHPLRIGNHGNVERLKMTTHGEGGGPLLFIPQTATRSGPYGGNVGLGRLYVTDWSDFNCLFENACAITEAELYESEVYFGTAWNKSYERLQGTSASIYRLSNLTEHVKKPSFKYRMWKNEEVPEGATTEAIFCPGYRHVWVGFEANQQGDLKLEVDPYGQFHWKTYETLSISPNAFHSLSINGAQFTLLRLKFDTAAKVSAFVNISP